MDLEQIYKFISYAAISISLVVLSNCIESNFLIDFNKDFITLITTLFAINVASTSIVFSKLKEINSKSGINFIETRKELEFGFRIQIILIAVTFLLQIFISSKIIDNNCLNIILNSSTIFLFCYFLEITYDLGKTIILLFTKDTD